MIDEGVFPKDEDFHSRLLNEAVHDICLAYDGYFLLGSQDFDIGGGRKLYNCAYLFGPGGDSYQEYRKTRLVILGEFLPFGNRFPWLRKLIGIGMDFTPGPGPKVFDDDKSTADICTADLFRGHAGRCGGQGCEAKARFFYHDHE